MPGDFSKTPPHLMRMLIPTTDPPFNHDLAVHGPIKAPNCQVANYITFFLLGDTNSYQNRVALLHRCDTSYDRAHTKLRRIKRLRLDYTSKEIKKKKNGCKAGAG